jgi:outer membrane lipoprotein-sorting protein
MSLDVSNITMADVNPQMPPDSKNAKRHPQGMPRMITDTTELSIKRAQPTFYYIVAESVAKIDRQTVSNTFAIWKSDKGQFMFSDNHQKIQPPTYQQIADNTVTNADADQFKKIQQLFDDPANLTMIIKDLGQTDDESVNGQDCYTLTAKVIGQKVKVWVDKTTYLIPQWQITLGGTISDADVDDAFSLYASGFTNLPSAALDMMKTQVKKFTPVMTKIRGTITSTTKNVETNPTLSADDFYYDVPAGVRLTQLFKRNPATRGTSVEVSQRNACINNLRQIDAAKNEFALEKGKANGTPVTEADIKPYIKLDTNGNLPKCPAGGTYTIGNVGEKPTCSVPGHALP